MEIVPVSPVVLSKGQPWGMSPVRCQLSSACPPSHSSKMPDWRVPGEIC